MLNSFIFDYNLERTTGEGTYSSDAKADLTLPILPPPKRFLLRGSVFNTSPNTIYSFFQSVRERRPKNKHVVDVSVDKIRLYEDKLQLISIHYFFDRKKNYMSEKRGNFKMLTYNGNSKALYIIDNIRNLSNGRFRRSIRRISLNGHNVIPVYAFDSKFIDRWISALYNMVKNDVPDVYDECITNENRIIALILQHRLNKGIVGLTDNIMHNIATLSSTSFVQDLIHKKFQEQHINTNTFNKLVTAYKREAVYKFIPTLKKTNSTSKAFKTIAGGKHASKLIIKLLHKHDLNSLTRGHMMLLLLKYNKTVPNSLKHLLKRYVSADNQLKVKAIIRELIPVIRAIDDPVIRAIDDPGQNNQIIDNWIRTMHRIDDIIPWNTWRDMYDAAQDLGLRVRPSRITSVADVNNTHDEYQQLLNVIRDSKRKAGLSKDDMVFIKACLPEEFDGYKVRQLMTPEELLDEGEYMGHCVSGYYNHCLSGRSIIASIRDMNNNRLWTVEYNGKDFNIIQAEGKVKDDAYRTRNLAPDELYKSFLIPLGEYLRKEEEKQSVPYILRSMLNEARLTTEATLFSKVDLLNNTEEGLAEKVNLDATIDRLNYKLEKIIEFDKLIKSGTPIDRKAVIELFRKIETDISEAISTPINVRQNCADHLFGDDAAQWDEGVPF